MCGHRKRPMLGLPLRVSPSKPKTIHSTKEEDFVMSDLCPLLYKFGLRPERTWSLPCAEEIHLHESSAKEERMGKGA